MITNFKIFLFFLIIVCCGNSCKNSDFHSGTKIIPVSNLIIYEDNRPTVNFRLAAKDQGIILKHGWGPDSCDYLGARDVWVWEAKGSYYMHYDGAGPKGWLACLAVSKDMVTWEPKGPILGFGETGTGDCASASYGTTWFDGSKWHMFYLGTPHVTPGPDYVPAFPYLTMKAEGNSPEGPWKKRYDITPFNPVAGTYYGATASPGQIIPAGDSLLMFFSASTGGPKIMRTISIARTSHPDSAWKIDANPALPPEEQVENTSLYYQEADKTWFLFTNHVGIKNSLEYTDAVWVYWSKDLNRWDPANKAIVLDAVNCSWSKHIMGLPSVVKSGNQLALFYDGNADSLMPRGVKSHMNRDIGLAWIDLPVVLPEDNQP
jgi:predicted GH43/DUF377 family glycosyl hydrolase